MKEIIIINIDNANYISDYDGVEDYYLIYYGNIGDSLVLEIINNVTFCNTL